MKAESNACSPKVKLALASAAEVSAFAMSGWPAAEGGSGGGVGGVCRAGGPLSSRRSSCRGRTPVRVSAATTGSSELPASSQPHLGSGSLMRIRSEPVEGVSARLASGGCGGG